jgi:hypothetical protein
LLRLQSRFCYLPQICRGKFDRLRCATADLPPVGLMDMGFAIMGSLARLHRRPLIRFLFIGSHLCSTLPSDPASRQSPCASVTLHLHLVGYRTFTSQLSNMLGTRKRPCLARQGDLRNVRSCFLFDFDVTSQRAGSLINLDHAQQLLRRTVSKILPGREKSRSRMKMSSVFSLSLFQFKKEPSTQFV